MMLSGKQPPIRGLGRTQILTLAMASGLAAALLADFGLKRPMSAAQGNAAQGTVITAARDLPPRVVLSAGMLRSRQLAAEDVPAGAFHAAADLVGLVTTAEIPAGQALTRNTVTSRSRTDGIAPQIAPAYRAVAIPLDAAGGMTGFLEPGDHVDVMATFDDDNGQSVTQLVVQNARLLTLGTRTTSGGTESPATSATLEVTPRAAQTLALSAARGRLMLALRGLGDVGSTALPALPSEELAQQRSVPPVPSAVLPPPARSIPLAAVPPSRPLPPSAPPTITVVRGTTRSTMTVGE